MKPKIEDHVAELTDVEIVGACQDFVARGALGQAAADRMLQHCKCGHARAAHYIPYEVNLSHRCATKGCECIEFEGVP